MFEFIRNLKGKRCNKTVIEQKQLTRLQHENKSPNLTQDLFENQNVLIDTQTLQAKTNVNIKFADSNENNTHIAYLLAQQPFPETLLALTPSIRLQKVLKRFEKSTHPTFKNLSDCIFNYREFINFIRRQRSIGKSSLNELSELLRKVLSQILTDMSVNQSTIEQYISMLIDDPDDIDDIYRKKLISNINEQINSFLNDSNQAIHDYKIKSFSFKYTGKEGLFSEIKNKLDQRSFDILLRRFGLEGKSQQTLQEIADEYELTRERIRQIEQKAVKVKLETLKRAFFSYLDDQYFEITKKLFENEGYFSKDDAYALFKSLDGFTLLSIYICYKDIYDYLECNHIQIKDYWLDNSLSEEEKYKIKQEILGFGSLGIKIKTQLIEALTSVPWPIPISLLQDICTDLSEYEIVNGLEEHFDARFENNAVVAIKKGLRPSQKVLIVLRHAGHALPVREITDLYCDMFSQKVKTSYVSNILCTHLEALIVNRGEYDIYENLDLNEQDLSIIRNISFEYIKEKNTFVSAGIILRAVFKNQSSYGKSFNKYMLYGILQDDPRFIYKPGLMLGLRSFSSELFTSLTDSVHAIVKDYSHPIHIREIQSQLSKERNVLDISILKILEENENIVKVGPATFEWKNL